MVKTKEVMNERERESAGKRETGKKKHYSACSLKSNCGESDSDRRILNRKILTVKVNY